MSVTLSAAMRQQLKRPHLTRNGIRAGQAGKLPEQRLVAGFGLAFLCSELRYFIAP